MDVIKLKIENTSNEPKTAYIFGKRNMGKQNFGSDEGIVISTVDSLKTYHEIFHDVNDFPFKSDLMIYKSTNEKQVSDGVLSLTGYDDVDGQECTIPIFANKYIAVGVSKNVSYITYPINYYQTSYLCVKVEANTELNLEIYKQKGVAINTKLH